MRWSMVQKIWRLAVRVQEGEALAPQWAGLFYVEKAEYKEYSNGTSTILWTDSESGFEHPPFAGPHNDWAYALQNDPDWAYFIQD